MRKATTLAEPRSRKPARRGWLVISALLLVGLVGYYLWLRFAGQTSSRIDAYLAGGLLLVLVLAVLVAAVALVVSALRRRRPQVSGFAGRLALWAAALLVLQVGLSQLAAFTPPIGGADTISELRPITVNGRAEWLQLRGQDRSNPIILFLAGGPGGSQLATSRFYFQGLEDEYTIATWEQPGAAKSYFAVGVDQLSLDTYLDDGAAVVEQLRSEFGQDQIYLMGESWGSALGLLMAKQHPEYYAGFIGTGQMISFLDTELADYELVLADARERGDQALVDQLAAQGPPPYTDQVALKSFRYIQATYGIDADQLNPSPMSTFDGLFGVEYGLLDRINFIWGLYSTFDVFYPKLYDVDLRDSCESMEVPIHLFIGRHDASVPAELTEDYYRQLQAPSKELVYFEHSGHGPWQTENGLFLQHVREAFSES